MSEIRQISSCNAMSVVSAAYERLLQTLGTREFGSTVRDTVQGMTSGARRLYLFESMSRDDTNLHYFHGEPGLVELFPAYRKWYLRQDPVFDACLAAPECSDVAMQRVRPCHIASPGFRQRIFDAPGIIERVSIVQRGADSWRGISIARHVSDGPLSDSEIDSLIALAGIVLPMLPVHRRREASAKPLTILQLEQRFEQRFSHLTARERQVCARAAAGLSVAETASDLGIARTSVLTYRQRAYQRLQVASPVELCALVTH